MYLIGKKLRPRSISDPLGTKTPPPIAHKRRVELAALLKQGDKSVIDELITGHIHLAVYIAGRYTWFARRKMRDLVSEALLALVEAVNNAQTSWYDTVPFSNYLSFRINRACGNFLYNDKLIRIPISTLCLHRLKDVEIGEEQEVPQKVETCTLSLLILNETLENAIRTKHEREIVNLRKSGYTQAEIAVTLGMSQQWVQLHLSKVEERFLKGEKGD